MIGLGIETSCDETSMALVEDGKKILSHVIYSQIKEHEKFYGIVPEIASRSHVLKINEVYEAVMKEAPVSPESISFVSVTSRPGLTGSLMIGGQFAKTFSLIYRKPVVTVNHIEAHFYANFLERQEEPRFPFLGLLLSGGNTAIYLVEGTGKLRIIGNTQDDAIGEAFDKAASILGLGYPGGPVMEKYASLYSKKDGSLLFPKILKDLPEDTVSFSYSGLKTTLLYYTKNNREIDIPRVCHDFQEVAFELILRMLKRAIRNYKISRVEAGGGVLANRRLRELLKTLAFEEGVEIYYPENKLLCTDNAAMVAALGYYYFREGNVSGLDFDVFSYSEF